MTKRIDFQKYAKFVDAVTSDESRDFVALSDRLVSLDEKGANTEEVWDQIMKIEEVLLIYLKM